MGSCCSFLCLFNPCRLCFLANLMFRRNFGSTCMGAKKGNFDHKYMQIKCSGLALIYTGYRKLCILIWCSRYWSSLSYKLLVAYAWFSTKWSVLSPNLTELVTWGFLIPGSIISGLPYIYHIGLMTYVLATQYKSLLQCSGFCCCSSPMILPLVKLHWSLWASCCCIDEKMAWMGESSLVIFVDMQLLPSL